MLILIALIGLIVAASLGYSPKGTDWASRLASWAFSFLGSSIARLLQRACDV